MLTHIRYCDYLTTCPLLVLDLLWNLEAPYKWLFSQRFLSSLFYADRFFTMQHICWFDFGETEFLQRYLSSAHISPLCP
jgi:hypothetical protein